MAFQLVEIRALFTEGGVPCRGHVTFKRSDSLQDPVTNAISPNDKRTAVLDSTGRISIYLEATDSSGITPANTTYLVTETINGARRSYSIEVPSADVSAGLELADAAPATPGPAVVTYALVVSLTAETTRATAAEASLQGQITAEASTRLSADNTLQSNITTEATARASADTTLQTNITAEASARASAVTSEATSRANADSTHAAGIASPTALGHVKVGSGLAIDGTGVLSATGGGGASLSDATPHALGSAAPGTDALASRDDHVHAMPTAGQVGADATGTAASAVAAHVAAGDPHPVYLTAAEGNAAYDALGAASTVQTNLNTHTAATTAAHGGIVASTDARLTNARTPTAHASTHATGGSDPITAASIGADTSGAATTAVSAHVALTDPHTQYHNDARGDARYDALGAATTAVAAYAAATEGTSFPTSGLYDGQPFYRTDLGRLFHYNLTYTVWLSEPYSLAMAPFTGTDTFTVDGLIARGAAFPGLYPNAWIDSFTIAYEVSNNSGGRFWAYTVQEPGTGVVLVQGDTSADGNGVFKATKTQSDFGSFGMGGVIDNTTRTALEITIADNGGADPFKLYGISLQVRDALYT